ncbi:84419f28-391d-48aa-89a4-cbba243af4cf [Sclerotinia trifoliorum]|uniref:84419f28-391d-48aa-89a4-cbba243af4cf n=1 Tax=Sclerotinia trifoliorum TaxID=28548 RepID=A0A8H2VP84_9HELO|nr:84419f28-391d-48aa-89a4-cbba243af4cf [Sclerotinia trifoliorum]
MSTPMRGMLRTLRPTPTTRSFCPSAQRTFITLPGTEPQILTEKRILPYKSSSLYSLIADVDSYSTFVPYCTSSRITKWSAPDSNGKKWPAEASLTVGWAGVEERFTSKLLCVPGTIVEALSGDAVTSIPESKVVHHSETYHSPAAANGIFQSLNTRWSLKPFHYQPPSGQPQIDKTEHEPRDQTEVHLIIEFQFANPLYTALSIAVAPQVAPKMIEAFELRARKLLDGPGAGTTDNKTSLGHAVSAAKKLGA